jgi:hypothetical protein
VFAPARCWAALLPDFLAVLLSATYREGKYLAQTRLSARDLLSKSSEIRTTQNRQLETETHSKIEPGLEPSPPLRTVASRMTSVAHTRNPYRITQLEVPLIPRKAKLNASITGIKEKKMR